jgi:hypothetical protein
MVVGEPSGGLIWVVICNRMPKASNNMSYQENRDDHLYQSYEIVMMQTIEPNRIVVHYILLQFLDDFVQFLHFKNVEHPNHAEDNPFVLLLIDYVVDCHRHKRHLMY